ncbi:hypothetical protein B8W76_05880 [Pseudomonas aeruginosa]|uniref:hypothetical protein n=1 Tax=Pseudomonas aeruginosa TaxID=287 RepID=UPI000B3590C1|nr:hypothetical protein [Pseudomonas aeruginosa]OUM37333.1 hypothetical protein B8W76_05880 [Pseudomonas aeruginosa]
MSIDWNKAPEGATHYNQKLAYPWLKDGEIPMYFCPPFWMRYCNPEEGKSLIEDSVPRLVPTSWDGQGFPPIGIEAEAIWDGADIAYFRAKILAHDEGRVVFRWCEGKRKGQYGSYAVLNFGSLPAFRPLRTPEQIAAEEREKAVGDMAMSIQGVPYQYPTLYALFDAGYRRQEEGK